MATPLYGRGGPYTPKVRPDGHHAVWVWDGSVKARCARGKDPSGQVNSSQGPLSPGLPADRFPFVPASRTPTTKEILIVRRLTTGLALGAAAATFAAGAPAASALPGATPAGASSDRRHASALGLASGEKLTVKSVVTDPDGTPHPLRAHLRRAARPRRRPRRPQGRRAPPSRGASAGTIGKDATPATDRDGPKAAAEREPRRIARLRGDAPSRALVVCAATARPAPRLGGRRSRASQRPDPEPAARRSSTPPPAGRRLGRRGRDRHRQQPVPRHGHARHHAVRHHVPADATRAAATTRPT